MVVVCYSRAAASDGAESTSDTAPAGLQSAARHPSTAAADNAQELPYLPIVDRPRDRRVRRGSVLDRPPTTVLG